jgi:hypothetical protein
LFDRFLGIARADDAIIQTWDRHPARFLLETQPGTLTYLVNRYGSRH